MMLITIAFWASFAFGVAVRPIKEESPAAVIPVIPVSPVRPDWTTIPQGDRVLPRLSTASSVIATTLYLRTGLKID